MMKVFSLTEPRTLLLTTGALFQTATASTGTVSPGPFQYHNPPAPKLRDLINVRELRHFYFNGDDDAKSVNDFLRNKEVKILSNPQMHARGAEGRKEREENRFSAIEDFSEKPVSYSKYHKPDLTELDACLFVGFVEDDDTRVIVSDSHDGIKYEGPASRVLFYNPRVRDYTKMFPRAVQTQVLEHERAMLDDVFYSNKRALPEVDFNDTFDAADDPDTLSVVSDLSEEPTDEVKELFRRLDAERLQADEMPQSDPEAATEPNLDDGTQRENEAIYGFDDEELAILLADLGMAPKPEKKDNPLSDSDQGITGEVRQVDTSSA